MPAEIERKFLISGFPYNLILVSRALICQSYLSVTPEVRIQEKMTLGTVSYKMTVKEKGDLSRAEWETNLLSKQYLAMIADAQLEPIEKRYHTYKLGDHLLECSLVDKGKDTSFYYAEIEFSSEEEAKAFDAFLIPNLIKEITYDENYKMANYWAATRLTQSNASK